MRFVLAIFSALLLAGCASVPPPAAIAVSGQTVVLQGLITPETATEFLTTVQTRDVRRVLITSGGGEVKAAMAIGRAIHQRGLDVEVFGPCFSSCANYIFPAGRNKAITGLGVVGWHGNIHHLMHLHRTGEQPAEGGWLEEMTRLVALEAAFFQEIGVDGDVCWFGKIAPYKVLDAYFLSVEDMAAFGIGKVSVRADYTLMDVSRYMQGGVAHLRLISALAR